MTINPVWFGVLMTIVAEIIVVIVLGLIGAIRRKDPEEEADLMMTEEEFRETIANAIRESVGNAIREKMDGGHGKEE